MGTRSLTVIMSDENEKLLSIYGQWDGYREGLGRKLSQILHRKRVNGFSDNERANVYNGMEDLALLVASGLKKNEAGNFYLASADDDFEEWNYFIYDNKVQVYRYDDKEPVFTGSFTQFKEWTDGV